MNRLKKMYGWLWMSVIIVAGSVSCTSASQKEGDMKANPVVENIFSRKSVRNYLDKDVEKEKIDLLLRAAMAAPSGRDLRPWEFIFLDDHAMLDSLAAKLPNAKMLSRAHCAIVVCGDSIRSSYWYLDCSLAAGNILLTAESLGLGAVWTAAYPYRDRIQAIRTYVSMPGRVLPLCIIPIGYPAAKEEPKQKFDEKKIHYNNKW